MNTPGFLQAVRRHDQQTDRWVGVQNHIRELQGFLTAEQADEAAPQVPQASQGLARRRLLDHYLDAVVQAYGPLTLPGEPAHRLSLPTQGAYTPLRLARISSGDEAASVFAGLHEHRHLILVGPRGSGKTSTINHLAAMMATAIRDSEQRFFWLGQLPGWRRGPRLPIRVALAAAVAQPAGDLLTQLWRGVGEIAATGLSDSEQLLLQETLIQTLERGQGVLLLDGLDEVPVGPQLDRAHALLVAARERFGASYLLAAHRSDGYECPAYQLNGLDCAVLAPLDRREIEAFVGRCYRELAASGTLDLVAAGRRARNLCSAISASPRMQELASLPQQLATIVVVHAQGHLLPAETIKAFWRRYS